MTPTGKVLILDGMWSKTVAAVRSLGRHGLKVTAGEVTRLAAALFSRHAALRAVYPSPVTEPRAFLAWLDRELDKGYDAVLPFETVTQEFLAVHRTRIESRTRFPFAPLQAMRLMGDKAETTKMAAALGLPIPRTVHPHSVEEAALILKDFPAPAVVKPRTSSGTRGLRYVSRAEDLWPAYRDVHVRHPFPIVQERIPPGGEAIGVGALYNKGKARALFAFKRLREYPVTGGSSTLRMSVRHPEAEAAAERLLDSIGWHGPAMVEFKAHPSDGRPRFLEVNPRFWGSLSLAIRAGVDFPWLLYRMAVDGDIEPVRDYRTGVVVRSIVPGEILHFLTRRGRVRSEIPAEARRGRGGDDLISLEDPLPVIGRVLSLFPLLTRSDLRRILSN
ncbi:MAG: ATP-grasp domain-containing protein [Nitrospirae bacterium]|nr:ATP-grasp domain-containing protein [Nitrospirota bacterium]